MLIKDHPEWDAPIFLVLWIVPGIIALIWAQATLEDPLLAYLVTVSTVNFGFNFSIALSTFKLNQQQDLERLRVLFDRAEEVGVVEKLVDILALGEEPEAELVLDEDELIAKLGMA